MKCEICGEESVAKLNPKKRWSGVLTLGFPDTEMPMCIRCEGAIGRTPVAFPWDLSWMACLLVQARPECLAWDGELGWPEAFQGIPSSFDWRDADQLREFPLKPEFEVFLPLWSERLPGGAWAAHLRMEAYIYAKQRAIDPLLGRPAEVPGLCVVGHERQPLVRPRLRPPVMTCDLGRFCDRRLDPDAEVWLKTPEGLK